MKEMLNVINEDGSVHGPEDRQIIHDQGLLHQEVHVYYFTMDDQLIFQHRAKDKDTFPDKLDATVGGHVEIGDSMEQTAIKEAAEETGIKLDPKKLTKICDQRQKTFDKATGKINNVIRRIYIYPYIQPLETLRVEEGKALGFEAWPLANLLDPGFAHKNKFIPMFFDKDLQEILKKIQKAIRAQD